LEMSGHEVAVAFDGKSALEMAAVFQPDVFVLDLKLPDMSGHELLRRLKAMQHHRHTKSIALTGFGGESRRNDDVEFDHLLTKPVRAKELEMLLLL
jgi:CheY-like chemotaxis protein